MQWLQIWKVDRVAKVYLTTAMNLNPVSFLTDFINHWMTKIRDVNYAGFRSGGQLCDWVSKNGPS